MIMNPSTNNNPTHGKSNHDYNNPSSSSGLFHPLLGRYQNDQNHFLLLAQQNLIQQQQQQQQQQQREYYEQIQQQKLLNLNNFIPTEKRPAIPAGDNTTRAEKTGRKNPPPEVPPEQQQHDEWKQPSSIQQQQRSQQTQNDERKHPLSYSSKRKVETSAHLLLFPAKLHKILSNCHANGNSDIASWSPDGNSFQIHDMVKFENEIMPNYFGTGKLRSFQRNLNLWGFKKTSRKGEWSHPLFRKHSPKLCDEMKRVGTKTTTATVARSVDDAESVGPNEEVKSAGDSTNSCNSTTDSVGGDFDGRNASIETPTKKRTAKLMKKMFSKEEVKVGSKKSGEKRKRKLEETKNDARESNKQMRQQEQQDESSIPFSRGGGVARASLDDSSSRSNASGTNLGSVLKDYVMIPRNNMFSSSSAMARGSSSLLGGGATAVFPPRLTVQQTPEIAGIISQESPTAAAFLNQQPGLYHDPAASTMWLNRPTMQQSLLHQEFLRRQHSLISSNTPSSSVSTFLNMNQPPSRSVLSSAIGPTQHNESLLTVLENESTSRGDGRTADTSSSSPASFPTAASVPRASLLAFGQNAALHSLPSHASFSFLTSLPSSRRGQREDYEFIWKLYPSLTARAVDIVSEEWKQEQNDPMEDKESKRRRRHRMVIEGGGWTEEMSVLRVLGQASRKLKEEEEQRKLS